MKCPDCEKNKNFWEDFAPTTRMKTLGFKGKVCSRKVTVCFDCFEMHAEQDAIAINYMEKHGIKSDQIVKL